MFQSDDLPSGITSLGSGIDVTLVIARSRNWHIRGHYTLHPDKYVLFRFSLKQCLDSSHCASVRRATSMGPKLGTEAIAPLISHLW